MSASTNQDETPISPGADADHGRREYAVALIAAVAALVGTFVGGVSAYLVARYQTQSSARTAQAEFFNTQQATAYATFMNDESRLSHFETAFTNSDGTVLESWPTETQSRAIETALNDVRVDSTNVELGAGKFNLSEVYSISTAQQATAATAASMVACSAAPISARCRAAKATYLSQLKNNSINFSVFVQHARSDIANNGRS